VLTGVAGGKMSAAAGWACRRRRGRVGRPGRTLNGVSGRPLPTATQTHTATADGLRNAPPPPPQAALEGVPATDARWLGGHSPPNGTDPSPRHPGAAVQAPVPPQVAVREPQSRGHSDRPDLACPSNAVNGPCGRRATTSLHVGVGWTTTGAARLLLQPLPPHIGLRTMRGSHADEENIQIVSFCARLTQNILHAPWVRFRERRSRSAISRF